MNVLPGSHYFHRRVSDSYWIRFEKEKNISMVALQIILPYAEMIHPDDVDYIMSSEGRKIWFREILKRPIRLRSGIRGRGGQTVSCHTEPSTLTFHLNRVINAVKNGWNRIRSSDFVNRESDDIKNEYTKWKKAEGDKTLRLNYDLNDSSIVFDLGGYEGQWASDIFARYCCHVFIFEPVGRFADRIEQRFVNNTKMHLHRFGLASYRGRSIIHLAKDGSSLFIDHGETEHVDFVKASEYFERENIEFIDLMKINIEGGEYDLLEHLIATKWVRKIGNIQVQFHKISPESESRMEKIQNRLAKTHHPTYQFKFIWENWKLIEGKK
jgi:FkbM family methyltransferase